MSLDLSGVTELYAFERTQGAVAEDSYVFNICKLYFSKKRKMWLPLTLNLGMAPILAVLSTQPLPWAGPEHRQDRFLAESAQGHLHRAGTPDKPAFTVPLLKPCLSLWAWAEGEPNSHTGSNQRASLDKATRSQGQSSYPAEKVSMSSLFPGIYDRQLWR